MFFVLEGAENIGILVLPFRILSIFPNCILLVPLHLLKYAPNLGLVFLPQFEFLQYGTNGDLSLVCQADLPDELGPGDMQNINKVYLIGTQVVPDPNFLDRDIVHDRYALDGVIGSHRMDYLVDLRIREGISLSFLFFSFFRMFTLSLNFNSWLFSISFSLAILFCFLWTS